MSLPNPCPERRHWDGTPATGRPLRSLRVAADSPSRLLRAAQPGPCRTCGNHTDWYTRSHGRPIGLHFHELPSAAVPAVCRWHVASGVAYPSHDGSAWCRIPHTLLCPAEDAPEQLTPPLAELRRRLALRTRRLLDTGAFTPAAESEPLSPAATCRPARPIVQILYGRYLAARPIDAIQCVAQTRRRHRCTNPVLDPADPSGTWTLMPTTARHGQLALPARDMAVYDLSHLLYDTQIRWRTQRCTTHAAAPVAADLALTDWEPFDPLLHHAHIHHRLPDSARRTGRPNSRTCPARPPRGQA
ncbi:DUF6083 domain-containing protein [Streptomyces sp. NPDC002867]